MHNHGLLALGVKYRSALGNLSQAPNDSGVDETDRFIDVGIVYSGDQGGLGFLYDVLLDDSDACHVFDILVELGVDGHVLSPNSKALFVFIFVGDANDKGNARGVLFHHV
jgi:hypothetical protein